MQNYNQQEKSHTLRNTLFVAIGVLVLVGVISFIREVVSIRGQILAGDYNFEQYGELTSGQGGANIDSNSKYNVETHDDPFIGSSNPIVTIVEFGDFECPFCRQSFPIIRSLVSEFGKDVRYIYRDFPLESIHINARISAIAGYCAHQQNKFWPLHDKMFQNQDNLSRDFIISYANQVGLDSQRFLVCLDSDEATNEVDQDLIDGIEAGVLGTPTWFINNTRVAGVIPEELFREVIKNVINNK